MGEKINYQRLLDERLAKIIQTAGTPRERLLLHSCCAPCSSYVLEYLSEYFDITVFYYNPNITDKAEFDKRIAEQRRLIAELPIKGKVELVTGDYEPQRFFELARGLEDLPEGGERCRRCYALRLEKAAEYAAENGYGVFCTTLSISPHKNAAWLNELGAESAARHGLEYLYSDFKKRNGYKRSIELSEQYGLYRQSFCGCVYSQKQSKDL